MATPDVTRAMAEVLELLAAPPAAQRSYLERLGTWPSLDELGLEFDDIVGAYLGDVKDGGGTTFIRELDTLLSEMSGSPEAWEDDALDEDPRWARARTLAVSALSSLPQAVRQ